MVNCGLIQNELFTSCHLIALKYWGYFKEIGKTSSHLSVVTCLWLNLDVIVKNLHTNFYQIIKYFRGIFEEIRVKGKRFRTLSLP